VAAAVAAAAAAAAAVVAASAVGDFPQLSLPLVGVTVGRGTLLAR